MKLDLDAYLFTQPQLAESSTADAPTVENYVQYRYLQPRLIDGRRRFSGWDLLKLEFIWRLASVCGIKPKSGADIAAEIIDRDRIALASDARSIAAKSAWALSAVRRVQLDIVRGKDGWAEVLYPGDPRAAEAITFVFPTQIFARIVLQQAAAQLSLGAAQFQQPPTPAAKSKRPKKAKVEA